MQSKWNRDTKLSLTIARAVGLIFVALIVVAPTTIVILPVQAGWSAAFGSNGLLKSTAVQILGTLLLLVFAWSRKVSDIVYCSHPLVIALMLFMFWATLSILWSFNRDYTVVYLMRLYVSGLLGFLVFQIRSKSHFATLLGFVYFGCVLLSAFGLLQHFFDIQIVRQVAPPASTFGNRNAAAQVIVVTWLLGIYFLSGTRSKGSNQYFLCCSIALVLAYIVHISSRAAWVAMGAQVIAMSAFVLAAKFRSKQPLGFGNIGLKPILTSVLVFLVLVNMDSSGYKSVLESIATEVSDIATVSSTLGSENEYSRFKLWRTTYQVFLDQPILGVGLGGFEAVWQRYTTSLGVVFVHAHNDLFQIMAELGIVGGLLALSCVGIMLSLGYRFLIGPHDNDTFLKYLVLVLIGGLAVTSLFSTPLTRPGPLSCLGILFGVLLGLEHIKPEQIRRLPLDIMRKRKLTVMATLIMACTITINVLWSVDLFRVERSVNKRNFSEKIRYWSPVEHPRYRSVVLAISHLSHVDPQITEFIAKSFYTIGQVDTIINGALTWSLIRMEKFDEARKVIAETRPMEPAGYFRSYEHELFILERMDEKEEVRRTIREMESFPAELLFKLPETVQNMANSSFNNGDHQKASFLLEQNIKRFPTFGPSNINLAKIYLLYGHVQPTEELLEKFIAKGGSKVTADIIQNEISGKVKALGL